MKKYIFFTIVFVLIIGCSSTHLNSWKNINKNEYLYIELKSGDIIIKEKQFNILGIFGHVGIMKIVEIWLIILN